MGKGVQQDYFESAKWFLRAAEQGHPIAENVIGYMYWRGEGVSRDYRQAVEWFRKAAEQNYGPAQLNLAALYQNGVGVPLNYAEAYKWFTLAANYDDTDKAALAALTQIMTTNQLRDGQARVADWLSHRNNPQLAIEGTEAGQLDIYANTTPP
jgi:TPR repeat protein